MNRGEKEGKRERGKKWKNCQKKKDKGTKVYKNNINNIQSCCFFFSLSTLRRRSPSVEKGTVSQTSNESTIQKLNTVHLPLTLLNTLSLNKVCGTIYYSRGEKLRSLKYGGVFVRYLVILQG